MRSVRARVRARVRQSVALVWNMTISVVDGLRVEGLPPEGRTSRRIDLSSLVAFVDDMS